MQEENSIDNFSTDDKLKALAIVHIFETSRAIGDYTACVVLNDGAGVSYGIDQFTHRAGSLLAVVEAYLTNSGKVGASVLEARLPLLRQTTPYAVHILSHDGQFKKALRAAAVTSEMKAAQQKIAFERYLKPALRECAVRGFVLPLSLTVIFDSITHGNWARIAASVGASRNDEKAWITEYVRRRHFWLTNVPRLKPTSSRTKFYLGQIAIDNWHLRLPINVNGLRLTDAIIAAEKLDEDQSAAFTGEQAGTSAQSADAQDAKGANDANNSLLTSAGEILDSAAEKFDRVDGVVTSVTERADSVKSLWTTVIGGISQAAWAVIGFLAGLPTEVWIIVALIAAALMLLYLYRQIEMGKIRESRG